MYVCEIGKWMLHKFVFFVFGSVGVALIDLPGQRVTFL